jgi:hypothetical protein
MRADRSFLLLQDKCFASQRARSLMSPAMTFLSKMSDTTSGPLRVTESLVSADRGLGVTSHDVSVKVSDIQPKWRFASHCCC